MFSLADNSGTTIKLLPSVIYLIAISAGPDSSVFGTNCRVVDSCPIQLT